jgi:hypothetical protein
MEEERITDKIKRIGQEGEDKAKEYLSKQGFIIFNWKEVIEKLIKYGINLHTYKKLKEFCKKVKSAKKQGKFLKEISEEMRRKYKLILNLKEKENYEEYAVNQIKVFEELGCALSEKEKDYLEFNSIGKIGDLIGKRISDNKLTCFEVKSFSKDYFTSGFEQFEENCMARKSEISVFYVLNNHKEGRMEMFDIKELWFNWHFSAEPSPHETINIIKRNEAIEKKKKYYSNTFIQFELIKCLKNRELCMLSHKIDCEKKNVRFLLAFSLDYLRKHLDRFDFHESLANLYHSVALLKPKVPVFSYNWKERRKTEEYKDFNENYKDYVEEYNLFIDLDADWNWKKALQEALKVKEIFNEFKVPYYVLNSSFKGFHFHIPAEYMPKKEISELLEIISKVVYNIKGIYDLEAIDTSIFDLKRVCKLPYSYVADGSVCLPLTDEQLKNFTPEMVKMENVLKNVMIKNRGLLVRDWGLTKEQLQKNVLKFLDEFK